MQQFPVDDEVVEAVWKRAHPRPFENLTFNSALRRVLDLDASPKGHDASPSSGDMSNPDETEPRDELEKSLDKALAARPRSKAPKTNLRELVLAGLLSNGEELFLVDYHGVRVQQFKATISGAFLQFKGQHYSMSDLARDLLKRIGFRSDSVRGPAHWVNAKEVSVKDLWQQLLDRPARSDARSA
jgi:hypothetical protein